MSDVKLARLKHELHSIRKGDKSIVEFLVHTKRLCNIFSTFDHAVSKNEQVQVILVGLRVEYDSIITLATYSPILMKMEQLVKALFECETRQRHFVRILLSLQIWYNDRQAHRIWWSQRSWVNQVSAVTRRWSIRDLWTNLKPDREDPMPYL